MLMLLSLQVGVYGHVFLLLCCLYLFGLSWFWPSCIREFVMVCVWLNFLRLNSYVGRDPHPP